MQSRPSARWQTAARVWLCLTLLCGGLGAADRDEVRTLAAEETLAATAAFRGPVDVCVARDASWAVTINDLSHSVSLVDLQSGKVLDELSVGQKPAGLAILGESEVLVSCRYSGTLHRLEVVEGDLLQRAVIEVGGEPLGIAVHAQQAYIGLQATGEIAVLDLESNQVSARFPAGRWPRYLAVSRDGSSLAVGLSGASEILVMDAKTGEERYREPLSSGINIGHLQVSRNGGHVYFPWMVYRANPINVRNIQKGWVLASRVARIRLDGPAYREALSVDVPRLAMADVHGIALTPNEHRMAVSSAGTHELLVYRLGDLPFVGAGGPGDLIDPRLMDDPDLFYRIELGGRPLGVQASRDNSRVFVANHLLDAIQVVNLETRIIERTLSLGPQPDDAQARLVHRGNAIFHDAEYSLDQWYSCHSCHLDGGSNAKPMDTWNDGTELTHKSVPQLFHVTETGPWTWHGWQEDLRESLQNSFVSTMQGEAVAEEDLQALHAYLEQLEAPPNPFRTAQGELTEQARRGQDIFRRADVGCSDCHSGPRFTDGAIHEVGLERPEDRYRGYNTPSLLGVYRKPRLLHDGRGKDLETVLRKWHRPQEIGGGAELSDQELQDLVAFLKSL